MIAFKDHFSRHAELYRRYRPPWPAEVFDWLATLTPRHDRAWDVGTGSGQATPGLARHFREVIATDASAAQIAQAEPHPGVTYAVGTAERSELAASSVDLVLAAQAFHWFDFEGFFAECRRVVRPGGVVAALTYLHPRAGIPIDAVIAGYTAHVLADWPPERRHVDAGYATTPFPFPEVPIPDGMALRLDLTLDDFIGYLATWSAAQRYRERTGLDPRRDYVDAFAAAWGDPSVARTIRWPIAGRVGHVQPASG